ncbi:hypothetical protein CTI14_36185, partial [Methylobacterium radiotolerans]
MTYADAGLQRAMGQALRGSGIPTIRRRPRGTGTGSPAILATDQGRRLLGQADAEGSSLATRVNALATVRADAALTGDVLRRTDDPWTNPAVLAPTAQASAQQYLTHRGDAPVALSGSDLDNTVGTAMGLAPAVPAGADPAQAEAAAARGQFNYFGSGDNAEPVKAVADQIRAVAGDGTAAVTVLPVTYSDGETGPVQVPLFRVTDPTGAERYVDNTGRRYDDFADWRANNVLPPGTQILLRATGTCAAAADGRLGRPSPA